MKKIVFSIIAVLLLTTLVACRQKDDPANIANPWLDHETLEESCAAVGYDLTVPEHIDGYDAPIYRTLNDEFIEIIFPADNNEIRIRKAASSKTDNDISGDYNNYTQHTALHNDKISGDVAGNDGMAYRATWQSGKYSYSITAQNGIEMGTMYGLIDAVR